METFKTACIIGHRDVEDTPELRDTIRSVFEAMIDIWSTEYFLFGSGSNFDRACLSVATGLREKYPQIRRIYVRAEFPDIDERYRETLLEKYDDTFFPEELRSAGRARYVERNRIMIDMSDCCVFYYDPDISPTDRAGKKRKSGTEIAYTTAVKKKKEIFNIAEIMYPEKEIICPEKFVK